MQHAETELKFAVADPAALERMLRRLGFREETPRTFESNTLYDTPERALKARGEVLRLRQYGTRATVTHKRHPDREDLDSPYKTRIETESTVDDAAALDEIFTRLGYAPAFRYEKFRSEWSDPQTPGAALVLDETPIGTFAELEGAPAWIEATRAALGIAPTDCLTASYGKLFLAWKERTGSPEDHMIFASAPTAPA